MIRMTALAAESMMPATMSPTASSILSPSFSAALPLMSAVMTCHIKAATDGSVPKRQDERPNCNFVIPNGGRGGHLGAWALALDRPIKCLAAKLIISSVGF